jgi:rubrerythrin
MSAGKLQKPASEAEHAAKRCKTAPNPARTDRLSKSNLARKVGRATERATVRTNVMSDDDEIDTLYGQLDAIDDEDDDESSKECDIIRRRFEAIAQDHNASAAEKANVSVLFACSVCMDNKLMGDMRIVNPCGHGYCQACIEAHMCGNAADTTCPTCRGPITSLISPYF